MSQYDEIRERIDEEMNEEEYNLDDNKITHVENLFIISYLAKAIQDLLIRKSRFFQYPLLIIDIPLAFAILLVNVERIFYVKILGYVLSHIQYDVAILKSFFFVKSQDVDPEQLNGWQEKAFAAVRKFFRFLWGVLILLLILPVWPLIWIYNKVVQTLLIAIIYYFLMFFSYDFIGGFVVYYLLLIMVTFLVSSITVPLIFRLSIYVRAVFSLEKKSWNQVHKEARLSFVKFYQRLHGKTKSLPDIQPRYANQYVAEGGVYYMLLKFLHYIKDQFWELRERKMNVVVEKIHDSTVEFVDDYYKEKISYYFNLQSLTAKDLNRTILALFLTFVFSISLAIKGAHGQGLIGPILRSFVEQSVSQEIWINYRSTGLGYYENMVQSYVILPNFLKYLAIGVDYLFRFFFQFYFIVSPVYLNFLSHYYSLYLNFFLSGVLWGTAGITLNDI